jgi:hypothetical protein
LAPDFARLQSGGRRLQIDEGVQEHDRAMWLDGTRMMLVSSVPLFESEDPTGIRHQYETAARAVYASQTSRASVCMQ